MYRRRVQCVTFLSVFFFFLPVFFAVRQCVNLFLFFICHFPASIRSTFNNTHRTYSTHINNTCRNRECLVFNGLRLTFFSHTLLPRIDITYIIRARKSHFRRYFIRVHSFAYHTKRSVCKRTPQTLANNDEKSFLSLKSRYDIGICETKENSKFFLYTHLLLTSNSATSSRTVIVFRSDLLLIIYFFFIRKKNPVFLKIN